jgi:uncharacterized RDD family membrane protein YckC
MTGVVSGEGVAIDLDRAGLGTRLPAAIIDLLVQFGLLIVASIVDGALANGDEDILTAVVLVEVVLVFAGYPIVFEWLSRGKTLGKMAMGLRVVRDDGGPIGFRQALVRGLSSFILEKPGIFLPGLGVSIGVITIGAAQSHKRVGDMMAGTFVVNERAGPKSALQPAGWYVPPALYGWAQSLDLSGVDDQLALQVRQFVLRAPQMTPAAQAQLSVQLANRLLTAMAVPPPPGSPPMLVLTTMLAERRRRADVAAIPIQPVASPWYAGSAYRAQDLQTSGPAGRPPDRAQPGYSGRHSGAPFPPGQPTSANQFTPPS